MKKILYLHQYFKTNQSSGGTRSYEFAKYLSLKNNIIIIAGESSENTEDFSFKVRATNTKYNQRMSFVERAFSFFHYIIQAIKLGFKEKNVDIIFATSTPLTIGIPALILKKLKKSKLIFEVRDVWPDVPVELGFIKNKFLIKLLKWFETLIYKNSEHIIVASEGMYENLKKKGVSKDKMTVIHNLSNIYLYKDISEQEIKIQKEKYFLQNKFVCIHPGTMGFVNGLDYVLDLGKILLEKDSEIEIILVGEGKEKEKLKQRIENEYIKNVKILDSLSKNEIVKLIKSCDVGLMITKKFKILEDNSANKFFDFLAAGLPVFLNYGGWQKKVLEDSNSGYGCLVDDPREMAEKILKVKNKRLDRKMGKNAYQIATTKYSTEIACEKLNDIIKKINGGKNV